MTDANSLVAQAKRAISIMSGGSITDDNRFSERQVIRLLDGAYSTIVRQTLEQRNQTLDPQMQRTFCVPLLPSNMSECGCRCPSGCKVLKGYLPKFISPNGKPAITFFGATDGTEGFDMTDRQLLGMGIFGRFSGAGNKHKYFLSNNTVFVFAPSDSTICEAMVRGVTDSLLATASGKCYDIWGDSGISVGLAQAMREMVISRSLVIESQSPRDEANNANER